MARLAPDQAEGLRRLFVADVRRMIALVSNSGRGGVLAAQLAHTLGHQGLRVLLVDEQLSAGRQPSWMNVVPAHDLDQVLYETLEIESAIVPLGVGVHLLAGGGRSRALTRPRMEARVGLVNAFYRLAGQYDVVLVNTQSDFLQTRPSFAWACQDVILCCEDTDNATTRAYASIKLLHQAGERRFHLLFDAMQPLVRTAFYRRIASVTRRHLQLTPVNLGLIPDDAARAGMFVEHLAEQLQSWPLPENQSGHFPALMRRLLRNSHTALTS